MQNSLTGQLLVASSIVTDPLFAGGVCLVVHQDEENSIGVMLNRPLQPTPEMVAAMLGGSGKAAGDGPEMELDPDQDDNDLLGEEFSEPMPSADSAPSQAASENPGRNRLAPGHNQSADSAEMAHEEAKNEPWRMLHFGGPLSGPVVAIHALSQFAEAETGKGIYMAAQKQHLENLVRSHTGPCRLIVGHLGWQAGQLEREIEQGVWHVVPATSETVFSNASEMWPRLIRRATSNSLARWIGARDVIRAGDLN